MRVWLIQIGEPLPSDGPNVRLFRVGLLAEELQRRGHEVVWWTSTFDHFTKKHRYPGDQIMAVRPGYTIRMLHSTGYARNVSPIRLIDHAQLARKFSRQARREPRPDIIHCSFPTIDFSVAATEFGKREPVPVVLDMQDMWPDVLVNLAPAWGRPLARVLAWPMYAGLSKCCRQATAITGMSPGFVNWGLSYARRDKTSWDRHFPFGYVQRAPELLDIESSSRYWAEFGLRADSGEFIVCFLGTIGRQFDLETVIWAAILLKRRSVPIKFVLCGDGDKLSHYRNMAAGCDSVIFPGRVGRSEMWTLMRLSSVGLAPYRPTMNFMANMPNKIAEYLSAGLPILTSLPGGYTDSLLREHGCGASYTCENVEELVSILNSLRNDERSRKTMSDSAKRLFEDQFTAERVYASMADYLTELAREHSL